jgi:DNA-binding MarR family transcriptional regulator
VLNPTVRAAPKITAGTISKGSAVEGDASVAGLIDGVSGYLVDLWIDLVSQAESAKPPVRLTSLSGLSWQQFRALNCLQTEPMTMRSLAQCLNISAAAATSTADRLVSAGAVERFRDSLDRRLVRVAATVAGVQMAADYRASQVATLERLLGQLQPARRAILALAMNDVAAATDPSPRDPTDNLLSPDLASWSVN